MTNKKFNTKASILRIKIVRSYGKMAKYSRMRLVHKSLYVKSWSSTTRYQYARITQLCEVRKEFIGNERGMNKARVYKGNSNSGCRKVRSHHYVNSVAIPQYEKFTPKRIIKA
jgi:hypothetical protein